MSVKKHTPNNGNNHTIHLVLNTSPILVFCTCSYVLCICCDSSEKNVLIFIHIWYSNQVPCIADICIIEFGSMLNLSNYGNIFILFYVFL